MEHNFMIGLFIAIFVVNIIAFKTNKRLTLNQIVHIWAFTIAFQKTFDIFVDYKYHGYWYFTKDIDWLGIFPHTFLIPAVNMMFLNWYPFEKRTWSKITYVIFWYIGILGYELIALLPEPWGYFHYGWWNLSYSAFVDPILLFILLSYYKWIVKVEKKLIEE